MAKKIITESSGTEANVSSGEQFLNELAGAGAPTNPHEDEAGQPAAPAAPAPGVTPPENAIPSGAPAPELPPPATPAPEGSPVAAGLGGPGEPPASPFLSTVRELGFQDVNDEASAAQRLQEAWRRQREEESRLKAELERLSGMATLGQQYVEKLQDPAYRQFDTQRQAPAAETKPAEEPWWNPPAYNPDLAARYRVTKLDAAGQQIVDWKDGTPEEIKKQAEQHQAYVDEWAYKLVHRPQEVLPQIIQREAAKIVERVVEERIGNLQHTTELERLQQEIVEQNPWLFAVDPVTNQRTHDYSPAGQMALQHIQEAQQLGISDPRKQWEYARNAVYYQVMQAQAAPPQPSAAPLSAAAQITPVPAPSAAPVAAPAQNPQATIAQRNMEYMRRKALQSAAASGRSGAAQSTDAEEPGARGNGRRRSSGHDLIEELSRTGAS